MRIAIAALSALALCLSLGSPASAQENDIQTPPKALKILRESIKPGQGAAHTANETAWIRALQGEGYDVPTLAMTSLTGTPEVWFLVGFPSWSEYQKYLERWDADPGLGRIAALYGPKEREFVSESVNQTCRFHREYSYQPDFNIGAYKYIAVGILRFRPGADIGGYFKTLATAREKAKLDNHTVVYEVNSGAHGGTYLTFTPMSSMARWDAPQDPAFLAALRDANWRQLVGANVVDSEYRLFAFSPGMSLPTKEIVAADPAFWKASADHQRTPAKKK